MHRDILSGELEPDSKLRLQGLQERYGLGMSPIREALMLLSREGLVSNEGQRGFRVAPVSAEDLRDIVYARTHIETILLTESISHGDADWGAEISAAFYKLTHEPVPTSLDDVAGMDAWEAAHRRFHRALLAGARSPWLHRIHVQLFDHAERYRRLRLARLGFTARTDSIFNEHQELMEATLSREVARACAILREHLNATLAVVDYLGKAGAKEAPALAGKGVAKSRQPAVVTRALSPQPERAVSRGTRKSPERAKV